MTETHAETTTFPPEPISARRARHLVVDAVRRWGLHDIDEAAALCTAELATNAVLHTRQAFTVTVRPTSEGIRIDVVDCLPEHLPVPVPIDGSAVDLTLAGTTGRGLQLVAALAARWGAFTAGDAKTVWAELDRHGAPPSPTTPVFIGAEQSLRAGRALVVHYLDLPVRTAVASGIQTDEAVREVQLGSPVANAALAPMTRDELYSLIDRSAPVRLAGRHAAYVAAGAGRERFDVRVIADDDAMRAVGELAPVLARIGAATTGLPAVPPAVADFRAWLGAESRRQRAGHAPRRCPLPV